MKSPYLLYPALFFFVSLLIPENFKGLKYKISSKLALWNRNRGERCLRGEGLYLNLGVWGGSRGTGLFVGRGAYLPLKHQQAALPPWSEKASASGREADKVLAKVIPPTLGANC